MRKDVKLGFAIGGVLLAVLIVYVLVVPGGGDQRLSQANGDGAAQSNGGVSLEPVAPTTPAAPATTPLPGNDVAQTPPAAPPASFTPAAGGTDPFEQPKADDEAVAKNDAKVKDVDWSKLLNDSQMLMVTPANAPVATVTSASSTEKQIASGGMPDITKPGPTPIAPPAEQQEQNTPSAEAPQATNADGVAPPAAAEPPTTPSVVADPAVSQPEPQAPTQIAGDNADTTGAAAAAAAATTHIVEMGETFTTISLKSYGDPNLYAGIMRANPGLDPQKLRPGMKIVIPPISQVRPPTPAAAAAPLTAAPVRTISTDAAQVAGSSKAETPIDPQTQYRVQPGDNLYSIAKKLYGRGDRSTRIFEANRQTMGEHMNALKPGQVLTLPEPPTAARQ